MKLRHLMASVSLGLACTAVAAAEFHTLAPGSGQLLINSTSGFNGVTVTGYSGSGGQFSGFFDTTNPAATPDGFLRFFCVEITQSAVVPGPATYNLATTSNDNLRKLYDIAYPNRASGDFWNAGAQTNFGVFSGDDDTAFQLAVWEITQDTGLNLSAGAFTGTASPSALKTKAQGWLDAVAAYSGTGYQNWTLYGLTNSRQQDYVTATYRSVPEPGVLGLLAAGFVGLFGAMRRRR